VSFVNSSRSEYDANIVMYEGTVVLQHRETELAVFPLNFVSLAHWGVEDSGATSKRRTLPVREAGFTQRCCSVVTTSDTPTWGGGGESEIILL
jgi:hypothetical protein